MFCGLTSEVWGLGLVGCFAGLFRGIILLGSLWSAAPVCCYVSQALAPSLSDAVLPCEL